MPRSGAWTGGWDLSIHRRWHLTFHLEMGALRPPVVTFAERAGSWLGAGLTPRLSPPKHSLQKCPSCPPWPQTQDVGPSRVGGAMRSCLLSFSLLVLSRLWYTEMASCISWSNDYSPLAIDWVFYKYLGLTVRNLSLRRTSLTCDSGYIVVCFLIASLRCSRKIRGFSFRALL
jgi:hypothetical protein